MSEVRLPDIIWKYRFPPNNGKKPLKIELFKASQWRDKWNPGLSPSNMYPKPPLKTDQRKIYFKSYYRVRINNTWYSCDYARFAQYHFFTLEEALNLSIYLWEKEKDAIT